MRRVLITGANGQIGSELTAALRQRYGNKEVLATDVKEPPAGLQESGPFELMDCTDCSHIDRVIKTFKPDTVYHLAALLSAVAEEKPQAAWNVNIQGLFYVLEAAREYNCAVFTPSSIGAFGPATPADNTPQDTIQRPSTMYGVTKVSGELLCDYYYKRFGVDTRGVRYPGIISYKTLPGGGTTDYAVEIYYEAIKKQTYDSFLKEGTLLDMMYMPDALKAAIDIMEADGSKLEHRNAFNVTAISAAPEDFEKAIQKHIPDFTLGYNIDPVRQGIADSWPNSMDDSAARQEWGWEPEFDLDTMTEDMLEHLRVKLQ